MKVKSYLGIFEQKVEKLIKLAKKNKKEGNRKNAKKLLKEAKVLREIIRKGKEHEKIHNR